ncbi:MAG: tRNA lysidine(34) synthetase TilS [Melioribacteraceae bacterium]|nr:tRNA lysidine(34) synthetase TilS [Melioribacteraceae bacterium]
MHPKTIEQRVIKFIDSERMISDGDSLLIGLSGGADSVFAIYFFTKYLSRYKVSLSAAHLNHNLRGAESDGDEEFCGKICVDWGIPFYSRKVNVAKLSKNRKESLETAARNERYKYFDSLSSKHGFSKIVTAHNCSDNAETVLFNLSKGTGIQGISGIPPIRGNIIRPFLAITKAEIFEYLKINEIDYRTDFSNDSLEYDRNFIRHKVLSELKERINPNVEKSILVTSQNLRKSEELNSFFISYLERKHIFEEGESFSVSIKVINDFDANVFKEIVRKKVKSHFNKTLSQIDSNSIVKLAGQQVGKYLYSSGKIEIVRERGRISFRKAKAEVETEELIVPLGKWVEFLDRKIKIDNLEQNEKIKFNRNNEFICADGCSDKFIIRRWNYGDKFRPLGLQNFKKISDFLTDEKVDSRDRRNQSVLVNKGNVLWIVGMRIDDRFKLTDKSKNVMRLWQKKI